MKQVDPYWVFQRLIGGWGFMMLPRTRMAFPSINSRSTSLTTSRWRYGVSTNLCSSAISNFCSTSSSPSSPGHPFMTTFNIGNILSNYNKHTCSMFMLSRIFPWTSFFILEIVLDLHFACWFIVFENMYNQTKTIIKLCSYVE